MHVWSFKGKYISRNNNNTITINHFYIKYIVIVSTSLTAQSYLFINVFTQGSHNPGFTHFPKLIQLEKCAKFV